MFSPNQFDSMAKEIMSRLCGNNDTKNTGKKANGTKNESPPFTVRPSSALVILALLTDALEVISVLVDKDQKVQIILSGSLKQKTELEKTLDKIGSLPFDEVAKAFLNRLD